MRRVLIALYPRAVRDRYGAEILQLLHESRHPLRDAADVARHALTERIEHIMSFTVRRLTPPLALFVAVALGLAALNYGAVKFGMHQLWSFTRGGLPRLSYGAMFAAQSATLLVGLVLLAGAVVSGRKAARSPRSPITVGLVCAGFAAGDLALFAANGVLTADRVRMALIGPAVWGIGMAGIVWAYAVMRRRGVRWAGALATTAAVVVHLIVLSGPVRIGDPLSLMVGPLAGVSLQGYWDDLTAVPLYAGPMGFSLLTDVRGWLMILAAGFCLGLVQRQAEVQRAEVQRAEVQRAEVQPPSGRRAVY